MHILEELCCNDQLVNVDFERTYPADDAVVWPLPRSIFVLLEPWFPWYMPYIHAMPNKMQTVSPLMMSQPANCHKNQSLSSICLL